MSSLGNKQVMAKNIKQHMEQAGVSATDVCAVLKIPMPTFSDWINAKTYPRIDKIEMLANYFGVKKSDLIEEQSVLSDSPKGIIDITEDDFTYAMYNEGKELTPEQKQSLLDMARFLKSQNKDEN